MFYSAACRTMPLGQSFSLVCDSFLTFFCWLLLKLTNQNTRTVGGEVVKCNVGFPTNDNAASHSPCIFIGQMQWKPLQKVVKKMSKSCQKLIKNFV